MKIDVCRPPAPPRPPAEVIIYLTEEEARTIRNALAGMTYSRGTYPFYCKLDDAVRSL